MRCGKLKLASLCVTVICVWVTFPSHLPIPFADALSVTKRSSGFPPPKQRTKPSIQLAASASSGEKNNNNDTSNQSSSSSSLKSATIPQEIFNLIKSIIGAGVLSLPAGIAVMASIGARSGSSPSSGIVVATSCLLIAVMGGISAYTFSLIARVCKMTNSDTYADCWKATRGPSFAWIVALSSTFDCFAGNLTFSMVLADTFQQLFSYLLELGGKTRPGILAILAANNTRSKVLLLLTMTSLLPLCCVKNLSTLAPFSLVGILGISYTAFVIGLRCFDGSYKVPNGRFLSDLESVPSFSGGGSSVGGASLRQLMQNPKSLILVSMLSTAYIAHFNAPKFYRELKDSDSEPKRFHLGVVAPSFAVCVLFYAVVSSMGYLTFGSATKGMILSNYSTNDVLISLSRFALGISLVTSYPLLFVGLRSGIVDLINQVSPLLGRKKKDTAQSKEQQHQQLELTDSQSDRFTVVLLSLITVLALKITDITFVASMSGALLGTSLIFIFPPLMFRSALDMESKRTKTPFTSLQIIERRLCLVIVALGMFIAAVGTKMAWAR